MNYQTISDIRGMNMAAKASRPPRAECPHAITDIVICLPPTDILSALFGLRPRRGRHVICCDCGKYMRPAR